MKSIFEFLCLKLKPLSRCIFVVTGMISLLSCSDDNLPKFNQLESLRILAFTTPTPEVDPGTVVTLTPVISDLSATSLTFSASACLDPGIGVGASPTCENNPTKVTIATNQPLALPGVGENWTGLADNFNVTVPNDAIIFAGRSDQEKYNGVSYLVEYSLTNNSGQTVTTIKRIVVSESAKAAKNQNPVTTDVLADGVSMTALTLGAKQKLSTNVNAGSFEVYNVKKSDGSLDGRTEELVTTWFITDGKTKYFRSVESGTNEFTNPDAAPVGRSFYLLAVTRDGRGGVSLVKKKF